MLLPRWSGTLLAGRSWQSVPPVTTEPVLDFPGGAREMEPGKHGLTAALTVRGCSCLELRGRLWAREAPQAQAAQTAPAVES